ncbi:hypothetical protein HaLaN_27976 [Haematococcus lacustris]|uniref:Uncharacterized protein n=1 Tax=Haematococcus lacustris TaxID=44745 RepID=A0A6A0ABA4_HAELA|nr:hypothetical protein HaLaN_27976 [Haematococcus lacustris]
MEAAGAVPAGPLDLLQLDLSSRGNQTRDTQARATQQLTSSTVTAAAASDLAAAAAPLQAAYTEPADTATAATLAATPTAAAAAAAEAEAGGLPPVLSASQPPWDGGEGGEGAAVLSHLACVRLLLQGGADPWLEDRQGATALEVAAGLGLGQGNALLAHHKRKQGLAVARLLDQHALFHACLRFKGTS